MVLKLNFLYIIYVINIVLLSVFPGEYFFGNNSWVSMHLLLSVSLTFFCIIYQRKFCVNIFQRYLLFFPLFMLVLVKASLLFSGQRLIFADFFELLRPFATFVFLVFSYILFSRSDFNLDKYFYIPFAFVVVYFTFIFTMEQFSVPYLGDIHSIYFRDKAIFQGKFIGSFSTTYVAGFFFVVMFCMFFSKALTESNGKYINYFIALCSIYLIIFTQSRSAFIGLLASFSTILFIILFINYKQFFKFIIFCTPLVYLFFIFFGLDILNSFPYLVNGINAFIFNFDSNIGTGNSLDARLSQFYWALDNNNNIFIGEGILKSEVRLLESWFALYYFRYGILGMASYIFFWFGLGVAVFFFILVKRRGLSPKIIAFLLGFVGMIASLLFSLFSGIPTEFMNTLMLWVMIAGFVISLISTSCRRVTS
jgi:hypothetical protein